MQTILIPKNVKEVVHTSPGVADLEWFQKEVARLKAENEALKKKKQKALTLKVSPKKAASLYGLGRFPVTLYKEQWERVLDFAENIKTFLTVHESELSTKED